MLRPYPLLVLGGMVQGKEAELNRAAQFRTSGRVRDLEVWTDFVSVGFIYAFVCVGRASSRQKFAIFSM